MSAELRRPWVVRLLFCASCVTCASVGGCAGPTARSLPPPEYETPQLPPFPEGGTGGQEATAPETSDREAPAPDGAASGAPIPEAAVPSEDPPVGSAEPAPSSAAEQSPAPVPPGGESPAGVPKPSAASAPPIP